MYKEKPIDKIYSASAALASVRDLIGLAGRGSLEEVNANNFGELLRLVGAQLEEGAEGIDQQQDARNSGVRVVHPIRALDE